MQWFLFVVASFAGCTHKSNMRYLSELTGLFLIAVDVQLHPELFWSSEL